MAQVGTRYFTEVIGTSVRIEQVAATAFELSVDGRAKGRFSSAELAREKLVSEIVEQIGNSASASEVPSLSRWRSEGFDLGDNT